MSKTLALALVLLFLTASTITTFLPAKAENKTIVVPDDYPTIQAAIGNATSGDTIFIKKGTYEEKTIEINKTLTIIGEGMNNTIIKLHPPVYNQMQILTAFYAALSNAITVNADDFKLYNLTIALSPDGYVAVTGDRTQIVGNNITGTGTVTGLLVNGSYCNITDNTSSGLLYFDFTTNKYVTDTDAGGFISATGSHNVIARNTFYRITISETSNEISNNTINILELSNASYNTVFNNQIYSETASYGVQLTGISVAQNNTLYHNNLLSKYYDHMVRLYAYNSTHVNFWDNGNEGNFWADYNGTDANGEWIGDSPYVIDVNNVDHYPLMNPLGVSAPQVWLGFSQTMLIIISIVVFMIVVAGLLVYHNKHKHNLVNKGDCGKSQFGF
jgi:nitrous oxidase accessory protein